VIEPTFGYARARDGAYIAYSTVGDGPVDLVWQFDWLGNLDMVWEEPNFAALLGGLASFSRLILHDRRATGLSSRNVPVPDLETRASDMVAVLETIGAERPILGGEREGGAPNILLAASQPERIRSVVWYAPSVRSVWAPDFPWGVGPEYVAGDEELFETWGTAAYGEAFARNEARAGHDLEPGLIEMLPKLSRQTGTPDVGKEMSRIWYETDIRPLLGAVTAPTLLIGHRDTEVPGEMEYVESLLPEATLMMLPGAESDGAFGTFFDAVRGFIGVDEAPVLDTVLATVLFTDIVGSTTLQASLGDRGWKDLIERHHAIVRDAIARYGGDEQDTAGDGFYARFQGPARAIRCATEITAALHDLGIEVRAGIHTGECEVVDGKCSGLSVSIGARVMSMAGPSEVLISQTVKDLVAGSGLTFEEAGEHELKGVPDHWRLYRVTG
jgi:class 3 adenylate cyclase/pimeloyl-ACP methyl ester carboxylesterase